MLLKILRAELGRLRREESGVAMMLTLSVILLLYVACAGIYSVGETVREKVELQNACDSAAYSAAVAQADGLSRMAMINRAMSWTYVQLTNMQIDYITYRWLQLVLKRFDYDKQMCNKYKHASFDGAFEPFSALIWIKTPWDYYYETPCNANPNIEKPGIGWFCGVAGYDMDCVRLNAMNNDREPISVDVIRKVLNQAKGIEEYATYIPQLKRAIQGYNYNLAACAGAMHKSVLETAAALLRENLPRRADDDLDTDLGQDFLGYVYHSAAGNPYEDGPKGYFSPLFNTELDERIFLSMADNEVYDTLAEYFGPSGDDQYRFGGLDQWFIRSYAGETVAEETVRRKKYDSMTESSVKALGICRVYKNTNLERGLSVYRDHHHAFGSDDSPPSCMNLRKICPEQCRMVKDSVALYADYEWSAGQYKCECTHIHHFYITFESGVPTIHRDHVCHFHNCESKFLKKCDLPRYGGHQCDLSPGHSHKRAEYFSCTATDKELTIPFFDSIHWTPLPKWLGGLPLACNGDIGFGSLGFGSSVFGEFLGKFGGISLNDRDWKLTEKIIGYSNKYKPNGFARIYGDDQEIFDPVYYCGEVAKPWVLNDLFYGKEGAIVVGLARRQRNPWTWLLNGVKNVLSNDRTGETGLLSAFNPASENNYLVTFSASRAAHRFTPSAMAMGKAAAVGYPMKSIATPGEYETRYDAVCDDNDGRHDEEMGDVFGRFYVWNDVEAYREARVGCVCNDGSVKGRENVARFARCWNLGETDWDATLLPLRFALAGPKGECFDGFLHDNGNLGNITWEKVGTQMDTGFNPLVTAFLSKGWFRFFDANGNVQHYDESQAVSGEFLANAAPGRVFVTGVEMMRLPYSTDDPETQFERLHAQRLEDDGTLDLDAAIQSRVL